jgi:DNA-binding MarR family transcriptional regulator
MPEPVFMETSTERQTVELHELFHRLLMLQLRIDRLDLTSEKLRGIALLELHILRFIKENPNAILKDIREALIIPNSTLTSAVKRIERQGLVTRRINPGDLRSYQLELTAKGEDIFEEHYRAELELVRKVIEALDRNSDRRKLVELVAKVSKNLD